jgi:hypothetical protein
MRLELYTNDVRAIILQASLGRCTYELQVMVYNYRLSLKDNRFEFLTSELLVAILRIGSTPLLVAQTMGMSQTTARHRINDLAKYPWVAQWMKDAEDKYSALSQESASMFPKTLRMMLIFTRFVEFKQDLYIITTELGISQEKLDSFIGKAVAGKAGPALQDAFEKEVARRTSDTSTGKEAMLREFPLPIVVQPVLHVAPVGLAPPPRQLANLPAALVETARSPSPLPVAPAAPVVARSPSPLPVAPAAPVVARSPTPMPVAPAAPVVARSPTPSLPMSPSPPPPCSPSPQQPQHVGEVPWISSAPVESDQTFGDPWEDALSFFDPPENEFRMDDY